MQDLIEARQKLEMAIRQRRQEREKAIAAARESALSDTNCLAHEAAIRYDKAAAEMKVAMEALTQARDTYTRAKGQFESIIDHDLPERLRRPKGMTR